MAYRLRIMMLVQCLIVASAGCTPQGITPPGNTTSCDGGCGCTSDASCGGATPRCDLNTKQCVACLVTNDNCPMGSHCVASNGSFRCSTSCLTNADCPRTDAGAATECCNGACTNTSGDTQSCGGCGKVCPALANADTTCTAGMCALGACKTGFADCDAMATDGCEVDVTSSAKNCGACGKTCDSAANAVVSCQASQCVTVCNMGFADCDKDPRNGCEANTGTDSKNCGGCGMGCTVLPNATPVCQAGTCTVAACNMGFADCDKDPKNGCEVNLQTDPANCGGCGKGCMAANAVPSCTSGACGIASCKQGFSDCDGLAANGCEAPTSMDVKNCGGCARACTTPNGTPACLNSACGIASCNPGFADCDQNAANGCEVNAGTDTANCGGCGKACPMVQNGTAVCMNGTCMAGSCKFGFADCNKDLNDGCEANLLGPSNCGTCGNVCMAPPNASAGCGGGMCGVGTCNPLFGDCDNNAQNGCERNLGSDVKNCGACNKACATPNANPGCLMGQCGVLSCFNGFADCDMIAANGCESPVASDPKNCGQCNNACTAPANSTANCSNGACGSSCNFGFADCDKMSANGCEVNVQMDLNNCGQCGNVCMAVANGSPGCKGGMCGVAMCNMLYGDCDGIPTNGCEKNLGADINNCGACGKACNFGNAKSGCLNGQCGILSCNAGFADCDGNIANGCEVNLNTDKSNCGKCGMVCPMNTPYCSSGACGTGVDYGPMHTFQGLTSQQFITQGGCSPSGGANIDTDAQYFCQHFYGARLGMNCVPVMGYKIGGLNSCSDPKMHKTGGCTNLGSDIPNTICDQGACKIGNWNECTTGIVNLVCHCT